MKKKFGYSLPLPVRIRNMEPDILIVDKTEALHLFPKREGEVEIVLAPSAKKGCIDVVFQEIKPPSEVEAPEKSGYSLVFESETKTKSHGRVRGRYRFLKRERDNSWIAEVVRNGKKVRSITLGSLETPDSLLGEALSSFPVEGWFTKKEVSEDLSIPRRLTGAQELKAILEVLTHEGYYRNKIGMVLRKSGEREVEKFVHV